MQTQRFNRRVMHYLSCKKIIRIYTVTIHPTLLHVDVLCFSADWVRLSDCLYYSILQAKAEAFIERYDSISDVVFNAQNLALRTMLYLFHRRINYRYSFCLKIYIVLFWKVCIIYEKE